MPALRRPGRVVAVWACRAGGQAGLCVVSPWSRDPVILQSMDLVGLHSQGLVEWISGKPAKLGPGGPEGWGPGGAEVQHAFRLGT
jgi:hypothetical protein